MAYGKLLTNERELIIILCTIYIYYKTNDKLLSLFCIVTFLVHTRKLIENFEDNRQLFDGNRKIKIFTILLYLSFYIYIVTGDYLLFCVMFIYSGHLIQSTVPMVSQSPIIPDVYIIIISLGGLFFTSESSFYFLFILEIFNKLIF